MKDQPASGPCRDGGQYTDSGLIVAEIAQGTAAGGVVVQCPGCEADPARAPAPAPNQDAAGTALPQVIQQLPRPVVTSSGVQRRRSAAAGRGMMVGRAGLQARRWWRTASPSTLERVARIWWTVTFPRPRPSWCGRSPPGGSSRGRRGAQLPRAGMRPIPCRSRKLWRAVGGLGEEDSSVAGRPLSRSMFTALGRSAPQPRACPPTTLLSRDLQDHRRSRANPGSTRTRDARPMTPHR
jgi:hypothetical protein